MYRRQFVSPLLKRPSSEEPVDKDALMEKRARVSPTEPLATHVPTAVHRTPLLNLRMPNYSPVERQPQQEAYFNILWRNQTTRRNKTWNGDGVLVLKEGYLTLQDSDGTKIATKPWISGALCIGDIIIVGNKEVEVDSSLSKEDYLSGKPFNGIMSTKTHALYTFQPKKFVPPALKNTLPEYRTALVKPKVHGPRHDPNAPDAMILPSPQMPIGIKAIDVVLDPILARCLRPHQKDGVKFLYECVMGIKEFNGRGAILADEMGLGKTLTVIALIWTLLKQSPFPGETAVVKKVLVVCPLTLITNWRKEFQKWMGKERVGLLAVDANTDLCMFNYTRTYEVMLINYERVVKLSSQLNKIAFDLVICDEGHRIKSQGNKAANAIKSLSTSRRILLTGTPIQNDLGEFFAMADFVNPGLLETYSAFKKVYETPIVRARQPQASKKDVELGKARSEALSALTGMFVLRRTSDILAKYLPTKHEFVVFCTPTLLQQKVYKALLESQGLRCCLHGGDTNAHLRAITLMRKICNAVSLTVSKAQQKPDDPLYSSFESLIPLHGESIPTNNNSGKLVTLQSLLQAIRVTSDKVVLVSNFTKTLDVLQALLQSLNMTWCRLDGDTEPAKRQQIVDQFNKVDADTCFAFLLSSKSGGCGLNLIGASRLVLYDVDWNPSNDLQAMARIYRDGQTRTVHIYRFLTTGMMDEKIYQRQITKQALSDAFIDGKGPTGNSFSLEELRDLFSFNETGCDTHDRLECPCNGNGMLVNKDLVSQSEDHVETGFVVASQLKDKPHQKKESFDILHEFWHFDPRSWQERDNDEEFLCDIIEDKVLRSVVEKQVLDKKGCISYVFGVKRG